VSATGYGWLVLAFPLAGTLVNGLGFRWLPGRAAGWVGTAAILLSFLSALGMLFQVLDVGTEERHFTSSLYDYASAGGLDIQLNILVDPLRSSCAWSSAGSRR
jgi:NADH-quinone oxidoreductase subunit L